MGDEDVYSASGRSFVVHAILLTIKEKIIGPLFSKACNLNKKIILNI